LGTTYLTDMEYEDFPEDFETWSLEKRREW